MASDYAISVFGKDTMRSSALQNSSKQRYGDKALIFGNTPHMGRTPIAAPDRAIRIYAERLVGENDKVLFEDLEREEFVSNAVALQNNTPPAEQGGFMGMMERLAMSNIDVAKLEKMMDLHERMLDREKANAFAADYVQMKPNLPKVLRSKKNTQTNSNYAPLEDINEQVDPVLSDYGFGTSTRVTAQTETSVTVEAILWHREGHKESTIITMPLDNVGAKGTVNKTNVHATASSITYAKRVAICALLNISTGDDKDGNEVGGVVDTAQAAEVDTLLRDTKSDRAAFLKYFKIDDVREMKAKDYPNAIKMLKAKEKKNG